MSVPTQTGSVHGSAPGAPAVVDDDARITGLRLARALSWVTYAVVTVAIAVLVLAFFLQLFNASTAAEFTQWVYRAAERAMQPFRGIFPTVALGDRGSVLDLAMLFAIVAYGLFAEAVSAFVSWLDRMTVEQRAALRRTQAAERQEATTTTRQGPGVV